jgi:multiple sugar transport system ATP-binding protein
MGRALVRDARVYLLDEPLSNLDARLRDAMRTEIKRLHRLMDKTIIYVTHDQVEAMTLAERIVLLNEGMVEQQGTPLDLYERPATRFVAGFLGSPAMNFLEGQIIDEEGALSLRLGNGLSLSLPEERREGLARLIERKVTLGIRPQHMSKAQGQPRAGTAVLRIQVELVEPTGPRAYVSFDLGGSSVLAELEQDKVPGPGEALELHLDMHRAVLINPETGRVLY